MQNINLSFYIHIYAIDLNVQIDICTEWNRIRYIVNNIIYHTTHNNKFNPWIVCTSPIALQLAEWKGSQLRHKRNGGSDALPFSSSGALADLINKKQFSQTRAVAKTGRLKLFKEKNEECVCDCLNNFIFLSLSSFLYIKRWPEKARGYGICWV